MATLSPDFMTALIRSANESLVKLEMTAGVPTWEAMATPRHQRILGEIFESVRRTSDCGCHRYLDTYIRFSDGSFKRPDLALYCARLPDIDVATDEIPQAVIEIVSEGYEEKDRIGLPFYLAQGIADVVVYDPRKGEVVHATPAGETVHAAPVDLAFACGCSVTIPT
jgi:Uma2 family endonuclease